MRNFHYNWFEPNIQPLTKILGPLAKIPTEGLEIGSFEGVSACWFFENILTHPESRLTCVDHFKGSSDQVDLYVNDLMDRFLENTAEFSAKRNVIVDDCWAVWPKLRTSVYDFVFVDGSHEKWDVLHDAVEAFRVTKPGRFIIFDDYHWRPELESRPAVAVDAFLTCFAPKVEILERGHCVIVRKL